MMEQTSDFAVGSGWQEKPGIDLNIDLNIDWFKHSLAVLINCCPNNYGNENERYWLHI